MEANGCVRNGSICKMHNEELISGMCIAMLEVANNFIVDGRNSSPDDTSSLFKDVEFDLSEPEVREPKNISSENSVIKNNSFLKKMAIVHELSEAIKTVRDDVYYLNVDFDEKLSTALKEIDENFNKAWIK